MELNLTRVSSAILALALILVVVVIVAQDSNPGRSERNEYIEITTATQILEVIEHIVENFDVADGHYLTHEILNTHTPENPASGLIDWLTGPAFPDVNITAFWDPDSFINRMYLTIFVPPVYPARISSFFYIRATTRARMVGALDRLSISPVDNVLYVSEPRSQTRGRRR